MRGGWHPDHVELGQFWLKGDQVYRVIAICTEPTVTLELQGELADEHRETHAIPSRDFSEFVKLERRFSDGSGDAKS